MLMLLLSRNHVGPLKNTSGSTSKFRIFFNYRSFLTSAHTSISSPRGINAVNVYQSHSTERTFRILSHLSQKGFEHPSLRANNYASILGVGKLCLQWAIL